MNLAKDLDLDAFAAGTPCLTPAVTAQLAEAAVVCLEHHGHRSGVLLVVEQGQPRVLWATPDRRAEASHFDLQDATEHGATALAILWVRAFTELEVVRRARKGAGYDYHLGARADGPPFDQTHCLEISGLLDDDPAGLERRLKEKLRQVERGGSGLPGYAVVVGFRTPAARIGEIA